LGTLDLTVPAITGLRCDNREIHGIKDVTSVKHTLGATYCLLFKRDGALAVAAG
jgi:hypothetical protein